MKERLGNSHTYYNDMPQLFKEICRERGKTVQVRMPAQPGDDIKSQTSQSLENIKAILKTVNATMEKRKKMSNCQVAMNGLFNNRRINASVVPFLPGCLPAASTVLSFLYYFGLRAVGL